MGGVSLFIEIIWDGMQIFVTSQNVKPIMFQYVNLVHAYYTSVNVETWSFQAEKGAQGESSWSGASGGEARLRKQL